jgi:membrane-associated phospholipid phosphatase
MHGLSQAQRSASPRGGSVPLRRRTGQLVLNWLVFSLCYPLANHLAQQAQVRRSLALALDAAIPFLPWMIVPYTSSGLLFTLVFFVVRTPEQLRVVSRRLLIATVAGALIFTLVPARFSLARPVPEDALPAALFRLLDLVDQPFNQLPSLHVTYCVILWLALRALYAGLERATLTLWLVLVAASALLTWQHHLADVGAGLMLGTACGLLVQCGRTSRHTVAFYYAIAGGVLLLVGVGAWRSWVLGYAAVSLLLVALAYRFRQVDFVLKRAGQHPLLAWLLFWPYLAGYRLTWALVLLRERRRPAFRQEAPGLWIGRRLTEAEARGLPANCHVIDLCGELSETASLRGPRYCCLPLLDLQAPRPAQLRRVLSAIDRLQQAGDPVYVHCAMGYSRSRLIARLHSRKRRPCHSPSTS